MIGKQDQIMQQHYKSKYYIVLYKIDLNSFEFS